MPSRPSATVRDETGGFVYLRLPAPGRCDQARYPARARQSIIILCRLFQTGRTAFIVASTGAFAPEAHQGSIPDGRRSRANLAFSRLIRRPSQCGWELGATRTRTRPSSPTVAHERLISYLLRIADRAVFDSHGLRRWAWAIHGIVTRALGVEHFGQTGSIPPSSHYGMTRPQSSHAPKRRAGRPIRSLKACHRRVRSSDFEKHRGRRVSRPHETSQPRTARK